MKNRRAVQLVLKNHSSSGFTLAEIAVVIIIAGVLLATFAGSLSMYMNKAENKAVRTNMDTIQQALEEFYNGTGRFPCPARMDVGPDQPNFGNEQTQVIAGTTTTCAAVGPGIINAGTAGVYEVRVGALPVRSLNLPDQYAQDSWGNRYRYAVTLAQATFPGYTNNMGRIGVIDSAGANILSQVGTADYVVVSAGPDGVGAFSNQGVPGIACPAAPALQNENCDDAAAAVGCSGAGPCLAFRKTTLTATAVGNNFFDDYVVFRAGSVGATSLQAVPSGAVIAFNTPNCPSGWTEYTDARGRFVMGSGDPVNDAWGYDGPNTNNGDTGGRGNLTSAELPSHSHTVHVGGAATSVVVGAGAVGPFLSLAGGSAVAGAIPVTTDVQGGAGATGTNIPPYVAFLYCQKD